jgi:hypothetical protein
MLENFLLPEYSEKPVLQKSSHTSLGELCVAEMLELLLTASKLKKTILQFKIRTVPEELCVVKMLEMFSIAKHVFAEYLRNSVLNWTIPKKVSTIKRT